MEILTGARGGKYYLDDKGKKHYIKDDSKPKEPRKTKKKVETVRKENPLKTVLKIDSGIKRCCCCGKPLRKDECDYYDLESYCPKCALADGIISSLE